MCTLYVNDGLAIVQRNLGLTAADGSLGLVDVYIVASRDRMFRGNEIPD